MGRMRWILAMLVACQLRSSHGHAEAPPLSWARSLFQRAEQLQERRLWGAAAEKYREAASFKDTPGLRFRAGYCEERRLHLIEAKREYQRAVALLDEHPRADDVRKLLPRALTALEARIPTLTVQLAEPGAEIVFELDDKRVPAARLGAKVPLNPGVHRVRLRSKSGREFSQRVRLSEGKHVTVLARLSFPKAHALEPRAVHRPSDPRLDESSPLAEPTLRLGIAFTGLGVATGTAFALGEHRAARRQQRAAKKLDAGARRQPAGDRVGQCESLHDALADQRRARNWATLGFASAGVGTLFTIAAAWLGRGTDVATSARVTPNGATLTLRGSL